jgi:hypothetical protein
MTLPVKRDKRKARRKALLGSLPFVEGTLIKRTALSRPSRPRMLGMLEKCPATVPSFGVFARCFPLLAGEGSRGEGEPRDHLLWPNDGTLLVLGRLSLAPPSPAGRRRLIGRLTGDRKTQQHSGTIERLETDESCSLSQRPGFGSAGAVAP